MAISSRVKDKGDSCHTRDGQAPGSEGDGTDGSGRGVRIGGVGTLVNEHIGIAIYGHVGLICIQVTERWFGRQDTEGQASDCRSVSSASSRGRCRGHG